MLRTLRDLFDALLPPSPAAPGAAGEHTLQLATAVLLVEVMRSDPEVGADERRAVVDALRATFALDADEVDRLIELAEQAARGASDYFAFTSRVDEAFDLAQKVHMVELMWRVAYADGRLSAHEQHVMWRLADLLHVPHGAYVNAKMRARDAMGGSPSGAGGG